MKKVVCIYGIAIAVFITLISVFPTEAQRIRDGGTITVVVPPEPVHREGIYMVAKEVTGKVTIVIGGKTYTGTLTFPDTKVRRTGPGKMMVDQCTASGVIGN